MRNLGMLDDLQTILGKWGYTQCKISSNSHWDQVLFTTTGICSRHVLNGQGHDLLEAILGIKEKNVEFKLSACDKTILLNKEYDLEILVCHWLR